MRSVTSWQIKWSITNAILICFTSSYTSPSKQQGKQVARFLNRLKHHFLNWRGIFSPVSINRQQKHWRKTPHTSPLGLHCPLPKASSQHSCIQTKFFTTSMNYRFSMLLFRDLCVRSDFTMLSSFLSILCSCSFCSILLLSSLDLPLISAAYSASCTDNQSMDPVWGGIKDPVIWQFISVSTLWLKIRRKIIN